MKQELLHVTKSLSSILSRVFSSIFICASNSFRACLVAVMIIAGMVGAVQQAQARKVYITCVQSGHGLGVYCWDGGKNNTWPGTISTSVTPLGGTSGGTGGFYSKDIDYTNYIVNNNSDVKKTNDLTISTDAIWGIFDSIQDNKSAELWTILMTSSTMSNTGIVQFASGGFSGEPSEKVATLNNNNNKFELTQAYTSGTANGIDVYINGTKFLYIKPADFGSPETATYKFTWDPTTGAMTAASTSCTPPTSGFAASGTYNSGNWTTRFANDYRTASLSTNQVADAYLWKCTSADSSKVSIASNTSKSTTATFDLPGEYTFRVGAKCTADVGYTYSETVTVNVPYPEIGISGPFYDGDGKWDHPKAGTDGKFSRSGLVYTKDFTVKKSDGAFVIIQAYKLGCEANSGWAGYNECNGSDKGNKINCSTFSTSTINTNTSSCGDFTQKVGLSNGQTARLTVTMTAYDSYTMLLELACTPPTGGTATATASSVCSGSGTTITLTGNTGTIQWQSSTNGTDYSDISGATSSPLSTGNLTVKTWYRAKVTSGSCGSAYSSVADVTVNPASVGGTATATASSVCSGSGTTITLTGNTGTIQWQFSTNGTDYSDISGETSSALSTGNLTVKTWYRAKVTSGSCSANSSVATVDVTTMPAVSITSGPDKMCGSLTTAGTYTATSVTGASYTWSYNVEGLSEYSKTDNSVTFTTGAVVSSGKISVYATLSGCNSNTAEKSVAIVTRPTVTGTTGASRCGTGTADISATVSGGSVDWYDAASAGTKKGSSASSANFTTASLSENTTFYAEANDGGCLSATRTAAAVTIKTSPVLSAITGSATTTQYKPETYTASGSNLGTLTWAIVGAPAHANISATTGSSTVFKAKDGSYTLSVTATNDGCTDNETKGITVSTDSETCP